MFGKNRDRFIRTIAIVVGVVVIISMVVSTFTLTF